MKEMLSDVVIVVVVGVGGDWIGGGGGGGEGGDGEFEVPAMGGEDLGAEVGIFQTGDRLEIRQFIGYICHFCEIELEFESENTNTN